MTESMNESVNNKDVCRTAPATLSLLMIKNLIVVMLLSTSVDRFIVFRILVTKDMSEKYGSFKMVTQVFCLQEILCLVKRVNIDFL